MPGCRVGISFPSLGIKNKAVYFLYSLFTLSLPQRKTLSYESDYFSARCLQRCCRYSYGVRGEGCVVTYGQIASLVGRPQCSRMVGQAMYNVPEELHLPCHRVVNSRGRLVPGWTEQRVLLENEGVRFKTNGFVDMKKSQWEFMKEQ